MDNINTILKKYWKIEKLKDKQYEIINNYLNNNDVIGLLPTGYGKSLCYLLPPLLTNKTIFIVSPLISLMEDQKEKLITMNIPVATLHGNNINKDKEVFDIIDGKIKIVYMSPEYLLKSDGLELANTLLEENKLGYFAIDESHCISVWGHDFRNEYLNLKKFRKYFPNIPIMAITATATEQVINDIIINLNMKNPKITTASFDRPNIYLKCSGVTNINNDINIYIKKYEGHKIIIYTSSREDTIDISKKINSEHGKISGYYHAGMDKNLRNKVQNKFNNNVINIIVSTIAFGMGIDQTIRCVIIYGSPKSVEEYYQMIGRAGRDGEIAETILFFQYKNIAISTSMIKKSSMDKEVIDSKLKNLNIMTKYFYYTSCRRRFIIEYFNQIPKFFSCNFCDNCCEQNNIDITDKFINIIFNKINIDKVFNETELMKLIDCKLIVFNNKYELSNSLKNWEKIIKVNNYLTKGIPNKYKILIKK